MPRVVRFHRLGGPEVLTLEDVPAAAPGPGEVRLVVEAFGLNRSEVQFRRGDYPLLAARFPARLGKEAVGVVEAVGPGVTGVAPGARVTTIPNFDMGRYGVYGETATVPAIALAPVPRGLSTVEAAAIWQQYLTVYGPFVEYGLVARGVVALITAAASSVGCGALQVARLLGATTIATTRQEAKRAALLKAGADHVVVTAREDLPARVREVSPRGADLVFDPVAGPGLATLAEAAAPGATIVLYGALAAEPTPYPLVTALRKGLSVRGYTMWEVLNDPARLARARRWIVERLEAGALRPLIDRTFPLDRIVEAHAYMESDAQVGKIVVTIQ
jgi:NADPH:quinone reductase-like Zn-dependent oxidoreductase